VIADRNDAPYPHGRGGSPESGGHPSGAWYHEALDWLAQQLSSHASYMNCIVVSHTPPRDTVIGTGLNGAAFGSGKVGGAFRFQVKEPAWWASYQQDPMADSVATFTDEMVRGCQDADRRVGVL